VASAKLLERCLNLLLLDIVILLVLGATREALPGQLALDEIEKDVTNGFEIITS